MRFEALDKRPPLVDIRDVGALIYTNILKHGIMVKILTGFICAGEPFLFPAELNGCSSAFDLVE